MVMYCIKLIVVDDYIFRVNLYEELFDDEKTYPLVVASSDQVIGDKGRVELFLGRN